MCESGAPTTYGSHITQLMTVMTQLQLPKESICRSILVYRGNDECPRVRKLGLVMPPYHTEPSKAIRAQWHSNMLFLPCLCQGVRVYMCEGVYV